VMDGNISPVVMQRMGMPRVALGAGLSLLRLGVDT